MRAIIKIRRRGEAAPRPSNATVDAASQPLKPTNLQTTGSFKNAWLGFSAGEAAPRPYDELMLYLRAKPTQTDSHT